MAGLEIEDLPVAPGPGSAAAEKLATPVPVGEQQVVGLRDVEGLAVDLLALQLKGIGYALGDGVYPVHLIHPGEVHFPPLQVPAGPQKIAEGL